MIPPDLLDTITMGDCRELAARIPDASVDLIFTDPVYWQIDDYTWLADFGARILKPGGSLLAYCGNLYQVQAGAAMLEHGLDVGPVFADVMPGPKLPLWGHKVQASYMPCLWFSKGRPYGEWQSLEAMNPIMGERQHTWGKNIIIPMYRIARLCPPHGIVLDTFCGGGAIVEAARRAGRHYIGMEIDPATAERARRRVANTQPPLPMEIPEQMELDAPVAE